MNPLQRVRNAVRAFNSNEPYAVKTNNSTIGNEFLRYGSRPKMALAIDDAVLSDEDMYTGYGYAIIERRANRAVILGTEYTYTKSTKKDGSSSEHPYLTLTKFLKGLQLSPRFDYDDYDSLDAEQVVQKALFGKVVYA